MDRLVAVALLSLLPAFSSQAFAVDWCTATPLPSDWQAQVSSGKLFMHWDNVALGPRNQWGVNYWDVDRKPTMVWCMARDDQNPPRTGQCVGLGTANCLQGWLGREASEGSAWGAWLQIYNQHSKDTRFVTMISDAPSSGAKAPSEPAAPLPPLPASPQE